MNRATWRAAVVTAIAALGADRILGGASADVLRGGAGIDTCRNPRQWQGCEL